MVKVLFVCHGNICRSPMGEYVLKDMVKKAGVSHKFQIASAAVSREEIGNPVYPPARAELARRGIPCEKRGARQLTRRDYDDYDLLIAMDSMNIRNIARIIPSDPSGKIHKLMDYTDRPGRDVADPWYSDRFDICYEDVLAGCEGLLNALT